MSEFKHTPGPWKSELNGSFADITNSDKLLICRLPLVVRGFGRIEGLANAKLINAAPVMLQAAISSMELFNRLKSIYWLTLSEEANFAMDAAVQRLEEIINEATK